MLRKAPLTFSLLMIAMSLALAGTTSAQPEDPPEDPLGGLLGEEEPQEETVAGLQDKADDAAKTLADGTAAETSLLQDILDGTLGFVTGATSALLDGLQATLGAIGDMIAAVFRAIGSASIASAEAVVSAIVWSVTGVAAIMTTMIQGAATAFVNSVTATWMLVDAYAGLWAVIKPDPVHADAWAGAAAVSTAGASAAAQYGIWQALGRYGWLASAGVPLFSRISKNDVLKHPLRSTIYETIRTNPGIHVSALSRQVDAGWGTTVHHLKKLQEQELVAVRTVNNQKCYFENGGSFGRSTWHQISELKNGTAQRIARFIYDHPLQPLTGISDTLGISPSLASHHITKLTRAGVLQKVRDGRFVKITVTEEARASLFESGVLDPGSPASAVVPSNAAAA